MRHFASHSFWACYNSLPADIQELADKNFQLLKTNLNHPSLHFKKAGKYCSARVGKKYRALAVEVTVDKGLLWFWIVTHSEYDRIIP